MIIEKLKKPNQTMVISNGEITATQRKAYNIILYQAQKELREDNGKTSFLFSISDLKKRAGIKATDNWHLKKDLEKLSDIKIETIKENKDDWGFFRLISEVNKEGDFLEIELSKTIREALIKNDYYTTLDLLIIKTLEGKYAVILYEMAIRYEKVKIPRMTIEEFKKITGTSETKSYNDFSLLRAKVIKPAIREINEKTDIYIEYKATKQGKSYIYIDFIVRRKAETIKEIEQIADSGPITYIDEVEQLFLILPFQEQVKSRKAELENLLKEHSIEYLKADIEYCKRKNPKNFWGYFIKSTKAGHYSKADIEKQKQSKERLKKRENEQSELEKLQEEENIRLDNIELTAEQQAQFEIYFEKQKKYFKNCDEAIARKETLRSFKRNLKV